MIKRTENNPCIHTLFLVAFLLILPGCGDSEEFRNKKLVSIFVEEVLNGKNIELSDEIFSPDIEFYRPGHKGDRFGINAFKHYLELNHELSPDLKMVVEDMIAQGNKVAVRFSISGTDIRSGRGYASEGMGIIEIKNGKIQRFWENADDLHFLIQIGKIPEPHYPHKYESQ